MDSHSRSEFAKLALVTLSGFLAVSVLVPSAWPASECPEATGTQDRMIGVRLEMTYLFNPHLNNFAIDTEVVGGKVLLTGSVKSDIDRDLAEEIAKSLDGVQSVDNELEVEPELQAPKAAGSEGDFFRQVSDATTTARIKTKLIANDNLKATDINVDTENKVVRLSGQVNSASESQLAEFIARNTSGVGSVTNELEVRNTDRTTGS